MNHTAAGVTDSDVTSAYLGLGANLGDPIEQLVAARRVFFAHNSVISGRCSSFYASSPVGYDNQPDFVNCVLELRVNSTYRSLFSLIQSLELVMGRQRDRHNQNAARCIDIDLLVFGCRTIDESDLTVPHPRMHERLFVLKPLQELNPILANRYLESEDADFSGQELRLLGL